jgi:hypothetical protein
LTLFVKRHTKAGKLASATDEFDPNGSAAFSVTSDVQPGTRTFASFTDAVDEIANARVFGGIHFRISCVRGNTLGRTVADYVSRHAMRAQGDERDDE